MNALFIPLFWIFNITLLLVLVVGFLPSMGAALIGDALDGRVPLDLMMPLVGLVGVPIAATVTRRHERKMGQDVVAKIDRLPLLELFYALEAPILTVCAIRLFLVRDLNLATGFLLLSGILGFAGSYYWFWLHRQGKRGGNLLSLAGLSLFLGVSLYLVAIASFFVVPIIAGLLAHFSLLMGAMIVFPIFVGCGIIASLPFGMAFVAQKWWLQNLQAAIERHGKTPVYAIVSGIAIIWISSFTAIDRQPQIEAFARLRPESPDKVVTLQKSPQIRQGLLNAYLSSYRYLRYADDRAVFHAYRWLQLPPALAQDIQATYNLITAPLTYQGNRQDVEEAAKLYEQFFDTPIARGETATIRHAVESNFNRREANAGLLSIDAKRVRLAQQKLKISPHGDWAEVELHETYDNTTAEQEEIFYYFSLPESAVVTGVWLGETENRATRYVSQISTRGAAQQVYKNEVRKQVDPALLEQVGPQNYRLRVYPVLPFGRPMHMWLTYKVMKQDGTWPLPHLNEQRNIYWNRSTQRSIDGKSIGSSDEWLPRAISADKSAPQIHQYTLPNGNNIIAQPIDANSHKLPRDRRLAVVLDTSHSMNAHRSSLTDTFNWLQRQISPHNQIDLYLTASGKDKPQLVNFANFKPADTTFYGAISQQQLLEQFLSLQPTATNNKYDAIVAISDRGSYELSKDKKKSLSLPAPLWMLHLDSLPPAYDDATLGAIQHSGGSISTDIKTLMERVATLPSRGEGTSLLSVVDNYAWFLSQAAEPNAKAGDEGFDAIAARQWITQVSQHIKPEQLKQLDAVHALAKRHHIVTPYSSAIVLVNDNQKAALKQAEQAKDRFQREVEDKPQPLPAPAAPSAEVASTPEPAEWLLIIIAIALLISLHRRQQLTLEEEL